MSLFSLSLLFYLLQNLFCFVSYCWFIVLLYLDSANISLSFFLFSFSLPTSQLVIFWVNVTTPERSGYLWSWSHCPPPFSELLFISFSPCPVCYTICRKRRKPCISCCCVSQTWQVALLIYSVSHGALCLELPVSFSGTKPTAATTVNVAIKISQSCLSLHISCTLWHNVSTYI
jgi:hypothetical protein